MIVFGSVAFGPTAAVRRVGSETAKSERRGLRVLARFCTEIAVDHFECDLIAPIQVSLTLVYVVSDNTLE